MKKGNCLKDDIESAERVLLIVSWLGVVSALCVVGFAVWGI